MKQHRFWAWGAVICMIMVMEFSADRLFLLDMQKDTIVNQISSVSLDPTNSNISITCLLYTSRCV